jgi:TetR/AcrR family transcriptional regulator
MSVNAPTDTRTVILDAAEELFASRGYSATTVKQIGKVAGVNSALLYYYFADKDTLYREVLGRLMTGLMTEGGKALDSATAPEDAIRALLHAQGKALSSRPTFARLIARELVDHEGSHATQLIAQLAAGVFTRLCDMIREGQRTGIFRAELDPKFAAISCISQIVYFHIARPAVRILLGQDGKGAGADRASAYAAHAASFAIAALTTPDAGSTSRRAK